MSILLWIVFGAIAGWLASILMNTDEQQGMLGNIVVGIVGAFVGGAISGGLGGPGVSGFNLTSLVVAVVGAVILLAIYRMFTHGGGHRTI